MAGVLNWGWDRPFSPQIKGRRPNSTVELGFLNWGDLGCGRGGGKEQYFRHGLHKFSQRENRQEEAVVEGGNRKSGAEDAAFQTLARAPGITITLVTGLVIGGSLPQEEERR